MVGNQKPIVVILLTPEMRAQLIPAEAEARLAEVAIVRAPRHGELSAENLPRLLQGAVTAITGWGTPRINEATLDGATSLRHIAHAAGSIRELLPLEAIEQGSVRVTHSAIHIGEAVAEFVLAQTLSFLRRPVENAEAMRRSEPWFEIRRSMLGHHLGAQTVGIFGAGYVGRMVTALFRAFDARVMLYDPYISDEAAKAMGAERASLERVLGSSNIISLHIPMLPETRHMFGEKELAMIRDGALFINTARGGLIDELALIKELRKNRFTAMLDVFETEPLPNDSPLRGLENAILAPHAAGHSHETYLRQGATQVDEVLRLLAGEPLHTEIPAASVRTMA
jgi:phosphoglycerate dehydrogenase-like enzyme